MNRKLLALSPEVTVLLDKEDNQSALVDAILHQHYGLTLEGEGAHVDTRRQVLEQLADGVPLASDPELSYISPTVEETSPADEPVVETPVEVPTEEPVEAPVEVVAEAPAVEYVTPEPEVAPEEVATPEPEVIGTPEEPVSHNVEAEVETVPEEVKSDEVPLVVKVNGQIAQVCELHGPYIGVCLDCL